MELTIRNDDVNSNSDFVKIRQMYEIIKKRYPYAKIISCISLLAKANNEGTLYPDLPLHNKDRGYFYNVDSILNKPLTNLGEIASHGLVHINHTKLSYDAQEMSIITSCNYLNTKLFVAPFSKCNEDTLKICRCNGIKILTIQHKWLSFEGLNEFNPAHPHWYFHSWRMSLDELKEKIK